jgi:CHAT domain-containing protein/Tfp pilus assembly protein PilF
MKRPPSAVRLAILFLGLCCGCREAEPPPPARPRAAAPPPSPAPVERPLALAPGTSLKAEIPAGAIHRYRFDLAAGQFADVVVEQWGIDLAVRLLPPDGLPFPEVDSPNGTQGPEPLPLVAGKSGTYRIEVRASGEPGVAAGEYAVLVRAARPATAGDRDRVEAERSFAVGEDLRRRGDGESLRAAVEEDREALDLFRRVGDRSREADVLYALGRIYSGLGKPGEAFAALQEALPVFLAQRERRKAGRTLNSLGPLHLARGDPEAALLCYRRALELLRASGDRRVEATALQNIGKVYASLGEVDKALAHYEDALTLWRELKLPGDEAKTLANRGRLHLSLDAEKACEDLRRALALLEKGGAKADKASVLTDLAVAEAQSGDPRKGLVLLNRALKLQRHAGNHRQEAVTLSNLAWVHGLLGEPEESRRLYRRALALFSGLGERTNQAATLVNLGHIDLQNGAFESAVSAYSRALLLFRAAGERSTRVTSALHGLSLVFRRLGDLDRAKDAAEAALDQIESLRTEPESFELRSSFFASQQDPFADAIDLLMELHRREPAAGHDRAALEASERAKARRLLDLLTEAGAGSRAGGALPFQPLPLAEIRERVLDGETLLLELSLGEERSFLWAVTRDRLDTFELPPRRVLESAARRTHALLADSRRTLARAQAGKAVADLSRMLLSPVAGRLEGRRLLFVPDGALHLIPFGSLPWPSAGGEPLLARHEIAVLPSASSLAAMRWEAAARRPPPGVVAVLADPVFRTRGPFARLPYSRQEARTLLALAPPGERLAALGAAASRETVTSGALERFRIVHFATHAVLDPEHPELSGIALSMVDERGRPREGFLRAHEIYRLRLPADLVVLSACETALGREVRGEGLVGLTQAFFHAGARRVLVSLWPVDDQATAELMRRFYSGLFQKGLRPAEALRQAQDSLRREPRWSPPSYWAGFILQGEGR